MPGAIAEVSQQFLVSPTIATDDRRRRKILWVWPFAVAWGRLVGWRRTRAEDLQTFAFHF
jgi:hypothetical protein